MPFIWVALAIPVSDIFATMDSHAFAWNRIDANWQIGTCDYFVCVGAAAGCLFA